MHGTAVFAHEQTAGKGQRGRVWTSEKSDNIILSIGIMPHTSLPALQFELSACMAVAIYEFFRQYAGNDTKIKWPNDLYWQDRKAGGILIESVVGPGNIPSDSQAPGGWQWAIIGIGININQTEFPAWLPNPVSLKQITGKRYDPLLLAKDLCIQLEDHFQQLKGSGPGAIFKKYNAALYKRNEIVRLKKENRIFEATVKAVETNGKLLVRHAMEEAFDFGEVEWVIEVK